MLGEHEGVHRFTVGQRRGLRIAAREPLYVIATEPASQRVIVGRNEDLLRAQLNAREVNWISIPPISTPTRAACQDPQQAPGGVGDTLSHRRSNARRSSLRRAAARRDSGPRRSFLRRRPRAGRRVDRITVIQYCSPSSSSGRSRVRLSGWRDSTPRFWISRCPACAARRDTISTLRTRITQPPIARSSSTKSSSPSHGCCTSFARFPQINRENISDWIRYEGLEHYLDAKKAGHGVLIATAHFGQLGTQRLRPRPYDGADERHDPAARQSRHRPPGGRSPPSVGQQADRQARRRPRRPAARSHAKRSRRRSDRSEHLARRRSLRRLLRHAGLRQHGLRQDRRTHRRRRHPRIRSLV